jgi:hypothetical protein
MIKSTTGATGRVTINLAEIKQENFLALCQRLKIDRKRFPPIQFEGLVEVDIDTIDEDEIAAAYESARVSGAWLERVYRYLAEYDCEAAMEELHRQFGAFGLAPPSHERSLVDCIQGFKGNRHVQG